MLERLTTDARRALVAAHEAARAAGAERISVCHLVYGLLVAGGDEQSVRLQAIGLTAAAVREHITPVTADSGPPPLSAAEARDLRNQLRDRGLTAEEARDVVTRVQQQRALGPVALDDGARAAVATAIAGSDDPIGGGELLAAVVTSPSPELAALLVAIGVAPGDMKEALRLNP